MTNDSSTSPAADLAARARDWAIWLTRQPSVTGSPGELALPSALLERVRATAALTDSVGWLIPAADATSTRHACAVLVKGEGPDTVLLTGHFDTVTVADYGELAPLATDPEALLPALMARLAVPATEAEASAKADFATGDFLPGRGLLDMKAGLAAGLAALERFAARPGRKGNLLFVAVPDEEVNSIGARALAAALPGIEAEHGLAVKGVINLDCIGDNGDGSQGRAVALGSVGKLLLTAYVAGQQSHASHPYQGVNAGAIAAAIAARLEWAPDIADGAGSQPGIPPTLLSLKDSKEQYDVTTPASVFATWNALSMGRPAGEVMRRFRAVVTQAVGELSEALAARRAAVLPQPAGRPEITVIEARELVADVLAKPGAAAKLADTAARAAEAGLSLPDQNQRVTDAAFALSGRRGPAVVLGFGSLPYPAVHLGEGAAARRLLAACEGAANAAGGQPIRISDYFPGISDMSFLGESGGADIDLIAANTPAWTSGVRWGGEIAQLPTVNIGPWGRDYHTPLERLHAPYAFEVLPRLLGDVCRRVIEGEAA